MREGHQTIRACSTNVKLPLGCEVRVTISSALALLLAAGLRLGWIKFVIPLINHAAYPIILTNSRRWWWTCTG